MSFAALVGGQNLLVSLLLDRSRGPLRMSEAISYNATLLERKELTATLAVFRVQLDPPAEEASAKQPWFLPGQYLVVGLNHPRDPALGPITRSYSLSCAPQGEAVVEFFIRRVAKPTTENPFTHLLFDLAPGDRLQVNPRPAGRFTLKHTVGEADTSLKLLVCAGTGLAPFMSMLRDRLRQRPEDGLRDFALLRAASYDYELGYDQELRSMAQNHGLIDLPTISRPAECPEWKGHCGRVEDFFLPDRVDSLAHTLNQTRLNPEQNRVLICGLQGTIRNCIERLLGLGLIPARRSLTKALGLDRKIETQVHFEQFDEEPIFDVKDAAVVDKLRSLLP